MNNYVLFIILMVVIIASGKQLLSFIDFVIFRHEKLKWYDYLLYTFVIVYFILVFGLVYLFSSTGVFH